MKHIGRDLRLLGGHRPPGRLPAVETAVEQIDLEHAHDAEHPPHTRRGKDARAVIDHDRVVRRNAHRADMAGEGFRIRQRVRQAELGIDHRILVEEDRAGNMRRLVFGRASRFCAGRYQEPSTIERPGVPSRFCSQSASMMKAPVSGMLCSLPRHLLNSGGAAKIQTQSLRRRRPEADAEAPVLAALLLDLADMDLADLGGRVHMRAAAGLAVDRRVLADADQPDLARCPTAAARSSTSPGPDWRQAPRR